MEAVRMHAVGAADVLQVDHVDTPVPGPGMVLIDVMAAGVTFGDVMRRRGAFGPVHPLPSGLGMQVAGTVVQVGPEVPGVAVGDRVAAQTDAGYAEYALARADMLIAVPDLVDFVEACVLPVQGITAYQVLAESGRIQPGETVLIHAAAGAVGSLAVQLARCLETTMVIGTAGSDEKLSHIRDLGADLAVNYRDSEWSEQVLEITGGRGVDVILDSVGGTHAEASCSLLAPFGRLLTYGSASGRPARLDPLRLMDRNAALIGYSLFGWCYEPARRTRAIGELTRYLASGALRVPIRQTFPLDHAADAHSVIEERRAVGGTVLLTSRGSR